MASVKSYLGQCRPAKHTPTICSTAYETDPKQLEYVNKLLKNLEVEIAVVWTYVAYMSGEIAVFGAPDRSEDSLQNIKFDSERSEFDDRLNIDNERYYLLRKCLQPFSRLN